MLWTLASACRRASVLGLEHLTCDRRRFRYMVQHVVDATTQLMGGVAVGGQHRGRQCVKARQELVRGDKLTHDRAKREGGVVTVIVDRRRQRFRHATDLLPP